MKEVNFSLKSDVSKTAHISVLAIVHCSYSLLILNLGFLCMTLIKFWYQEKRQETCVHTLLIIAIIVQLFRSIEMVAVHLNMCKTFLVCL